jgi:hypothetical protein
MHTLTDTTPHAPENSGQTPELMTHAILISFLAFSGSFVSWKCSRQLIPHLLNERHNDVWFDADVPQSFDRMVSRWSLHHGTIEHPFFSLLLTPALVLSTKLFEISPESATRLVLAIASGASVSVVYLLLLSITQSVPISVLWASIYITSAAFIFWCGIPESYCFGMLSLLLPFLGCAYLRHVKWVDAWISAAMIASLSITVTNVMSGLAVAFTSRGIRGVAAGAKTCIVVAAVMTAIQAQVVPGASGRSIFSVNFKTLIIDRSRFMTTEEREPRWYRPYRVLLAGLVVPEVAVRDEPRWLGWATQRGLTVQTSPYSAIGMVGVCIWILLLLGAVSCGMFYPASRDAMYIAIAMVAIGQLALHFVFGAETFLYSAHYGPVLILFSAYACRTRFRKLAVVLAVALLVIELANNIPAFLWSANYVRTLAAAG